LPRPSTATPVELPNSDSIRPYPGGDVFFPPATQETKPSGPSRTMSVAATYRSPFGATDSARGSPARIGARRRCKPQGARLRRGDTPSPRTVVMTPCGDTARTRSLPESAITACHPWKTPVLRRRGGVQLPRRVRRHGEPTSAVASNTRKRPLGRSSST